MIGFISTNCWSCKEINLKNKRSAHKAFYKFVIYNQKKIYRTCILQLQGILEQGKQP